MENNDEMRIIDMETKMKNNLKTNENEVNGVIEINEVKDTNCDTVLNNKKDREFKNDLKKIERNLRKYSEKIGVSYDDLNPKIQNYLKILEDITITTFENQNNAKKLLKGNNLKLLNLSKKSNISRRTFYNNPILKEYIELRDKDLQKINVFSINEDKTDEIRRLNEELECFKKRDFKYMDIVAERDTLQKENERLRNRILKLENEKKVGTGLN